MLPFEEALAIVLRATPLLTAEALPLAAAAGRVLREDVRADAPVPPFDRVAMDGYAVRAEDLSGAPLRLEVLGDVRAGEWPERRVGAGQALGVMTGAVLPEGATAVVRVEDTRVVSDACVEILSPVPAGRNVAVRGSEVESGDLVLSSGRLLDAAAVGVLAALGRTRPLVGRRPTLALLVTGDELVATDETPAPGRIRDSNGPALAALAEAAGAVVRPLGVASDHEQALAAAIGKGAGADVLVVSGGVSMGKYDLVEPALREAGFSFEFTAVAIRPGSPLVFGRRGSTLVFGLPGNPVSAQVTFELFVKPCLRRMQGAAAEARRRATASLAAALRNPFGRTIHVPAHVTCEDGRLVARVLRSMGSADLVAHAKANALVVLGSGREQAEAGEVVPVILLDRFMDDA